MIDLDELARLEREATPGPWTVDDAGHRKQDIANVVGPKQRDDNGSRWVLISDCAPVKDAALIAAMRNALPELLARVRTAEGSLAVHARDSALVWARRWKRLAKIKRLSLRDEMESSDATVDQVCFERAAARAELAAMTGRAERAEAVLESQGHGDTTWSNCKLCSGARTTFFEWLLEQWGLRHGELGADEFRQRIQHTLDDHFAARAELDFARTNATAARAEVERLRGVLRGIASVGCGNEYEDSCCGADLADRARAALKGEGE